jgi:RNA polymerase primary sigma factor
MVKVLAPAVDVIDGHGVTPTAGTRQGSAVTSEAVSTLTWYLEHVGQVPLLSAEQEVDLAKRARAGAVASELCGGELGPHGRARLRITIRDGRCASERLVEANLRLVVSIARRYRGLGLDFLDLVQEGNLGLLRAVARFDPARGFRFSTYASWWIRQAVLDGLARRGRAVRLPLHAYELARRLLLREQEVFQATGSSPSEEQLADDLDVRLGRLREIRRAARDVVSLDLPLGRDTDDGATIGDLVADADAAGPEATVAEAMTRESVLGALTTLSEREREVIELRFGLHDGRPHTLEELGARYGVTRERVRQIEHRALRKLSRPRLGGLLETAS